MTFDMPACSGCGNCTMACSFHRKGEFVPAKAAIRIVEKDDGRGFLISLTEENDGEKLACNGCRECVKHCLPSDALEDIIVEFLGRRHK